MEIRESAENYFETILMLKRRIGRVRSIDIVNEMGFSKPSVSYAMKQFRMNGYITGDEEVYITLTPKGAEIAERTYERHQVLTKMLTALGVDESIAKHDACRIEHDLSEESFACIKRHMEKNR